MARGAIAKTEVINRIIKNFDGAFLYNDGKEIRIPMLDNGEEVQIKVTLACAKENVAQGDDNIMPGEKTVESSDNEINFDNTTSTSQKEEVYIEPTEEEKQNVSDLLRRLGL